MRNFGDHKSWADAAVGTVHSLATTPAAIISRAADGGDNAPSDRVTPRNFRKTRKRLLQPKPGALGL
jgi:hypothetical protein